MMICILTGMFLRDSNCATARTFFLDDEELGTLNTSALVLYTINLAFILARTVNIYIYIYIYIYITYKHLNMSV
jgi:hypothetical protein